MDHERPSKWRRFSSSRLLRIDTEDPSFNFNFLGLPLKIKLLIIFRYLSVKDLLSMSLISKDYKQFVDQYFLRKEVKLPRCLEDYEKIDDRYVLSLKVDFDENHETEASLPCSVKERALKVIKRLNLSKMKYVSLVNSYAGKFDLNHHYNSDRSRFFSFMSTCPWYVEISLHVSINSTAYLQ